MRCRWLGSLLGAFVTAGAALAQGTGLPPGRVDSLPTLAPLAPAPAAPAVPTPSVAVPEEEGWAGCDEGGCRHGLFGRPKNAATVAGSPVPEYWYADVAVLMWWLKQDHTPALIATTTPGNLTTSGRFATPGTQPLTVLTGTANLDREMRTGMMVTAGWWVDQGSDIGAEVSGFFLTQRSAKFSATSDQQALLVRPFTNSFTGREAVAIVTAPGVATGRFSVDSPSLLWGIEGNVRGNAYLSCNARIDVLVGFRHVDLQEKITLTEATVPAGGGSFLLSDRFETRNQFWGGQIGTVGEFVHGPWSLDVRMKVAFGGTYQGLTMIGSQTVTTPGGASTTAVGGLLALSSNYGRYSHDRFSVIPELGLNVGYQLTPHIKLTGGYNLLYWADVARVGAQIDRTLDPTRIPGFANPGTAPVGAEPRPRVQFAETDFWAQGVNVGLAFSY